MKTEKTRLSILLELLKLVKPLKLYMILAITFGVLGFLVSISIPVLGTYALLDIGGFKAPFSVKTMIVLCIVFGIVRGFLRYGEQLCNHFIAFKVLALMRDRIFTALRKLAPAKFETKQKGALISMITSDVELMEVFYAHTISPVIIGSLVSLIMVIFIGSFHWILGLVAFSAYFFVGFVIPLIIAKTGKNAGNIQRTNFSEFHDYLFDTLRGMREIFQFGAAKQRLQKIGELSETLAADQLKLKNYTLLTNLLTGFALVFFPFIMIVLGGNFYQSGEIPFSGMLIPTVALLASFGPVLALSNVSNSLLLTFASGRRILGLIDEKPAVEEVKNGKDAEFSGLECEDISFSYEQEEILKNLSLKIEQNKITSIAGKSGAGKSTLLKLMM